MAVADNLITAYTNVTLLMASVTANPKPSYSVDGESWSWSEYLDMLTRQSEAIHKAIQREQGPYQIVSRGEA